MSVDVHQIYNATMTVWINSNLCCITCLEMHVTF